MDKIIQDPEKEMNSRTVQKLSAINYIFEYNLSICSGPNVVSAYYANRCDV